MTLIAPFLVSAGMVYGPAGPSSGCSENVTVAEVSTQTTTLPQVLLNLQRLSLKAWRLSSALLGYGVFKRAATRMVIARRTSPLIKPV